jgi:ribosomal-protein-alanine N-acetyltransferase
MGADRINPVSVTGIRPGRIGDAEVVFNIAKQSGLGSRLPMAHFKALESKEENFALIQESDGVISGFISGRQVALEEAEVLEFAVVPGARRKGIGGALLDAFLGQVAANGARKVFLEVRKSSSAAITLYESRGFTRMGLRPAYYRDPIEDAITMERKLTG